VNHEWRTDSRKDGYECQQTPRSLTRRCHGAP
jgi:hypothetical protein